MPILEKLRDSLAKRKVGDHDTAQKLKVKYDAAQAVADPTERALAYDGVLEEAKKVVEERQSQYLNIGWGIAVAGLFIVPPLGLVGAGFFAMSVVAPAMIFSGFRAYDILDSRDGLVQSCERLKQQAKGARDSILSEQDVLSLARSPYFDEAAKRFPDVKSRFIFAAAQGATNIGALPEDTSARSRQNKLYL